MQPVNFPKYLYLEVLLSTGNQPHVNCTWVCLYLKTEVIQVHWQPSACQLYSGQPV